MTMYMLSVHHSPDAPPPAPDDMQRVFGQVDTFNAEVQAAGAWVFAGGLEAPEIATVVSTKGGDVVMTDGPFAETKEHLGGFWVISAPDLDAARIRLDQPVDQPERRRLAAARRADEDARLAFVDLERERLDSGMRRAGEALGQGGQADHARSPFDVSRFCSVPTSMASSRAASSFSSLREIRLCNAAIFF